MMSAVTASPFEAMHSPCRYIRQMALDRAYTCAAHHCADVRNARERAPMATGPSCALQRSIINRPWHTKAIARAAQGGSVRGGSRGCRRTPRRPEVPDERASAARLADVRADGTHFVCRRHGDEPAAPGEAAVRIGACARGRTAQRCAEWAGRAADRTDEPTVPAADAVRPISCESSSGTT